MAKVITVNIPEAWLPAIDKLCGAGSLYVSRSEAIRKAIENRLATMIKSAKEYKPIKPSQTPAETDIEKVRRLVRETQDTQKSRNL